MRRGFLMLAVALAGLYLARNLLLRRVLEARLPLTIGRVELSPFRGRVEARDVQWRTATLTTDAAAVTVEYRTLSVLLGQPHLREVVVHLNTIQPVNATPGPRDGAAPRTWTRPYRIDLLKVRVGTVITPTKRYPLNQEIVFQNVTNLTAVGRVVFGQTDALKNP